MSIMLKLLPYVSQHLNNNGKSDIFIFFHSAGRFPPVMSLYFFTFQFVLLDQALVFC